MTRDNKEEKALHPNHLLRDARNHAGLSHQDVAKAIDLPDPHTVGRWERGISFPRAHYRIRLSKLFGKSLEDLGLIPSEQEHALPPPQVHSPTNEEVPAPGSSYRYTIKPSFTSFIGRERAVTRVRELLARSDIRLVTLLGTGGVGKTRLASEAAVACREQFGDEICMVSLAALREDALVLPTIASALQVRENATRMLLDDLQLFFSKKSAFLLILDNLEHLPNAASMVEALLAACPCLKVLVTSRAVLHIAGEHELVLEPLPLPEQGAGEEDLLRSPAVQLFVQRAQARLDTFQANPENLPVISQICTALDGLPLGIELAAARIKLFPLSILLEEITENRLHLQGLQNDAQFTQSRHYTLADTIKWSYDLLTEQEQWLFRHLALFPGGCTLAAAKYMWRASAFREEDVLSILMSLLDKNMLRPVAQEKTQPILLLLETIREYGLELLHQLDELEGAYQRLARYYLELLQRAEAFLKGPQQGIWLRSLDLERQNISAILAWLIQSKQSEQALIFCEVFGKFCGLRGYWSEEAHWLKAALDLSRTQPATVWRGRVLRRAGHLAYRMRDLPTARSSFEESIAIAREAKDLPGLAGALSGLAWVCYREQDQAPVADLLAQCVEVARASGDAWSLANALESRARFLYLQGNLPDASQLMDDSLTLARSIEDSENLARLLNTAISIEIARQHHEQAAEFARESFAIARTLGNKPLIALALNGLAEVAVVREEFQSAIELYQQRLQLAHELNDVPTVALMKLRLSEIALKQVHLEQAEQLARESLALFQASKDRANMSLATQVLEKIRHAQQSGGKR